MINSLIESLLSRGKKAPAESDGASPETASPEAPAPADAATSRKSRKLPGITLAQRRAMAQRSPSFVDMLPWMEYDRDGVVLLEDGISCGMMYELDPIPTEGADDEFMETCMRKVKLALSALPEWDSAQWVAQFFVNDDTGLDPLIDQLTRYILDAQGGADSQRRRAQEVLSSKFTQSFVQEMAEHLRSVAKPEGFFHDEAVSDNIWRGQFRRVRMAIYRWYPPNHDFGGDTQSPRNALIQACNGLVAGLREAGIRSRVMQAPDFYAWLLPFFNPRPFGDLATTVSDILKRCPYPEDQEGDDAPLPFGTDMGDMLMLSPPVSDPETGTWLFNGKPMRALALQGIREAPQGGHFTAERLYGSKRFARFDRMPPGTMLSCTMVVAPQDRIRARVQGIQSASRARTSEAQLAFDESKRVLKWMSKGDKLYPFYMVLYTRGEDYQDLDNRVAEITASLTASGLRFIDPRHELVGCDVFMRGLPMNFEPEFDSRELRRSRLVWVSQIAALLPLYGRARGTGNPGLWLWNRGGEPLFCDPLNKRDRKKNAHMLIFGPTGAGKSALLNYLCMLVMAIYRVRLVIVDAGNSMGLLSDHFKDHGLSVHKLRFTPDSKESLPPFADAYKLLEDPELAASAVDARDADAVDESLISTIEAGIDADDSNLDEKRDLLGEMVIQASLMITGGEKREIEKMSRADRYLIEQALFNAARKAQAAGQPHPRVQDVAEALMGMRDSPDLGQLRRERAEDMGQAMMVFCSAGLRGKLFNGYGERWPDADVIHVEMGTLAMSGYEDALSVAYTSLVSHVHALAEATHYEGRPLIFLTDEGHLITKNQLLSDYVVKITKMWRKLGAWFWLATQNMQDFPDDVARILSMCEWWWLLTMPPDEIDQVARFKTLTPEQRRLMESATKEPPKYTEGVVISSAMQALFRNVPPALPIALAMTEMHEKAERRAIMDEQGCSELEAAYVVAKKLAARREYA
jgi:conjugative transfer ATPase